MFTILKPTLAKEMLNHLAKRKAGDMTLEILRAFCALGEHERAPEWPLFKNSGRIEGD